MKHNKILALALLSSLALVGCGENKDLPNNDNNGNNSSQTSQDSSQSSDSTSNDTSIVNPEQNIEATVNNKQAFYEAFRGALDAESKYRGNLYGKADGTVKGLYTDVKEDGIKKDVSSIPEIASHSKMNIKGHAEVEYDKQKDDFNILANFNGISGQSEDSGSIKYTLYPNNNQKYIYQISESKYHGFPNTPDESLERVSGDILEHNILSPIQKSIQEFLEVNEFKNFNTFEEAIKPQIESLKQQGYNIDYNFKLVKNDSLYNVKLIVNGKGSLITSDPDNHSSSIPFDKLNDANATIELSFTNTQIKSLKIDAKAELVMNQKINEKDYEITATLDASGEAYLDHIVNDSFDVIPNSEFPESEIGEFIIPDKFVLLDQHKSSEGFNVYKENFRIYFNSNKLDQKIDILSVLQPNSLKHSKVVIKNQNTNELLDVNNYKSDSLMDNYEVSYIIEDGYALILTKYEFKDSISFNEINLKTSTKYEFPLPETINDVNEIDHLICVNEQEFMLKEFYKFQPESKSFKLIKPLIINLNTKDIHYIYIG